MLRGQFYGERGWQNMFILSLYAFTFIFIFVPDPTFVIFGGLLYLVAFGWLNAKYVLKKKEHIEGISFLDCLVVKSKKFSEPLLIGIRNYSELKLTEIDIEENEFYMKALNKYARELETKDRFLDLLDIISTKSPWETKKEVKKRKTAKKNVLAQLRNLNEMPELPEKIPEKLTKIEKELKKPEILEEKKEKKSKKKKKLSPEEINVTSKAIGDQTLELIEEIKEEQKPLTPRELAIIEGEKEDPDIDIIIDGIPLEKPALPLDYPLVRAGYHAYDIQNFEAISFSDSMHEAHKFNKMVLVTNDSFEDSFHFSTLPLWVDGYPVRGKAARCSLVVIDWIDVNYPILMLVWSERETINNIDFQIDADKIRNMREIIMQRIIYEYRNYFKRFELQIEELITWSDSFYENWQRAIQYLYLHKNEWLENPANEQMETGMIKVNKVTFYGLLIWSFISVIIISIFLIISTMPLNTGETIIP